MKLELNTIFDQSENTDLNQLDLDIITILQQNSRISLPKLSEKLRKHINTVRSRKQRLEKEKIIRKYGIDVNFQKLNFHPILFTIITKDGKPFEHPTNSPYNLIIETFNNKTIFIAYLKKNNFISDLTEYLNFFEKNEYEVKHSVIKHLKEG